MKKNVILFSLLVLGLNLYSQENMHYDKIEIRYGFLIHDYSLNYDTGSIYDYNKDIKSLIGFKNEIMIPTKKEYLNILVGYIFQYGRSGRTIVYTRSGNQDSKSRRKINNGGVYGGLTYKNGDRIGINSSIAMGLYFYKNILILDSEDYFELNYNEYSEIKSLSLGALISIGPYIKLGRTKVNLSFESLFNGNKSFMHFTYGGNLGMGFIF